MVRRSQLFQFVEKTCILQKGNCKHKDSETGIAGHFSSTEESGGHQDNASREGHFDLLLFVINFPTASLSFTTVTLIARLLIPSSSPNYSSLLASSVSSLEPIVNSLSCVLIKTQRPGAAVLLYSPSKTPTSY